GKHDDQRFGEAPEIHVEQQENDQQGDRHDDLEFLDGAFHVFKLAAPGGIGAGREFDLRVDRLPRLGDVGADVAVADIDVDVGREQRVFGTDGRGAGGDLNFGKLAERHHGTAHFARQRDQ